MKTHPLDNKEFPIVGIGASAGGLEALQQFFKTMPPDQELAFIVVVHLDPSHVSLLPELLQKQTEIKVVQIIDGMVVEPNTIYVIPPNKNLSIVEKKLQLKELELPRSRHLPIDFFLRSLAEDQGEKAVGIILSGTGSDGSLGLKEIKAANGLVIVQEEASAKYNGMPKNAINTGVADYILPPDEMPAKLIRYIQYPKSINAATINHQENTEGLLEKIFILIRNQTGQDFSLYKRNTLYRRIQRRMQLYQIEVMGDYLIFLQKNDQEVATLAKELLIGVTSFFRDAEAYAILQNAILPPLLHDRPNDYTLRVWVPGCSTGEEAYSLAIIIQECLDDIKHHINVQIFGTDINESAIEAARRGLYLSGIKGDISETRLNRFFIKEDDSYRIKKSIREMLVFATQNIIKDPPFTKLDIISCRNLLIYFGPELQKKILPVFHFSLKEDGIMILGPSETAGQSDRFFTVLDKKWKIFRKIDSSGPIPRALNFHETLSSVSNDEAKVPGVIQKAEELSMMQLVETILRHSSAPPCAIIDANNNIIYVHGRLGQYLEPAQGKISINIVEMARHGLKDELMSAIRQAALSKKKVQKKVFSIQQDGSQISVTMTINPILEHASFPGLLMVSFEDTPPKTVLKQNKSRQLPATAQEIKTLQEQLDFTKENLQTTIEELETSNEELKSTNEELQSTNEELQSTNEELETSKEELQSLNEEALTVNAELQSRIDELQSANDDMKNLFDSTLVATLFLDTRFCIRRITPKVKDFINVETTDIGRPIAHFTSALKNMDLTSVSSHVLKTLEKHESEFYDDKGRCFFIRVLPYRTTNNVIDGVAISFEDITLRKKAEQAVISSEKRYKHLFDFSPIPMWEQDFSKVGLSLQALRQQGVTDLAAYLLKYPQEVDKLLKTVRVLYINKAAMVLFKADNIETLALSLPELLIRRSVQPFIVQLQAIWDQQDTLIFKCHCDDLKGHPLTFDIKWVVAEEVGQLNYSNVIVVVPKLI